MKYCLDCGASYDDDELAFCGICNGLLVEPAKTEPADEKESDDKNSKKEKSKEGGKKRKKTKKDNAEGTENKQSEKADASIFPDDEYDGYYDDRIPIDNDTRMKKEFDKSLIWKIALIAGGALLIIVFVLLFMI